NLPAHPAFPAYPARYNPQVLRPYRGVLPRVHPSAFIDDSAQVIGDVEIGEESSVWMAVVVRGDVNRIRIGRRSNIQDGTVVHVMRDTHPTTIGDNVTIGQDRKSTRLNSSHDQISYAVFCLKK